jgi:hypothetical protein
MALETATYIDGLNASNPAASDAISSADDHMRLIKSTIKATFPNITGPVTKTQAQINDLLEKAGGTMTGPLTLSGAPSSNLHAATKAYVDSSISAATTGVSSFSAGTTGLTPSTGTTGAITLAGTLAIANGGTGATTAAAARTSLDVPSNAGVGASGTWGISISGSAASASSVSSSVVLDATAGASAGAVGTYGFFRPSTGFTGTTAPGTTISGSSLQYYSVAENSDRKGSSPSGTWRLMGYGDYGAVFLRIS